MRKIIILLALAAPGCDDSTGTAGEPDRSGYAPEDYVPAEIDMADYDTEAKRICLLYNAVTRTRMEDCRPGTDVSMSALANCARREEADGEWAWQAGCLDHMARATCAELEGPGAVYGNPGCVMVESWAN